MNALRKALETSYLESALTNVYVMKGRLYETSFPLKQPRQSRKMPFAVDLFEASVHDSKLTVSRSSENHHHIDTYHYIFFAKKPAHVQRKC